MIEIRCGSDTAAVLGAKKIPPIMVNALMAKPGQNVFLIHAHDGTTWAWPWDPVLVLERLGK